MSYCIDLPLSTIKARTFKVYGVLDDLGAIKYIGCTSSKLSVRLSGHIANSYARWKGSAEYNKFFTDVRLQNITVSVELIKEFNNPYEASELEYKLIKETKGLVNVLSARYVKKEACEWYMKLAQNQK